MTLARKAQLDLKIESILKTKKGMRPKKRKKDAEEDVLDRFADEEVERLRETMMRAFDEDIAANNEHLPATAKLKMLPQVMEVLQKSGLCFLYLMLASHTFCRNGYAQSIIDSNLLEAVGKWLEPLPDKSLPALNIQSAFFDVLGKMYIDTAALKVSHLGPVVLFYTKCKRVTSAIQRQAVSLVSTWSRPIIKRSASYVCPVP
jgi:transcription factor SPN1